MELKQYLFLIKRWAWLLILGLLLGTAGGYYFSRYQPLVYQTSTKVMVQRAPDERVTDYTSLSDAQLAKTYTQLIVTEPVLQAAGQKLGYTVKNSQVSVRQLPDTLLMELTVRDSDPSRAAQIANSLIDVFIQYNESLQTSRFVSSEQSLKTQIDQVEGQISSLQSEMTQASQQDLQTQQQQVENRISDLEAQIKTLNDQIDQLSPPTPTPTLVLPPAQAYLYRLTPTPEPTATPSAVEAAALKAQNDLLQSKISERDQLKNTLDLYQQVYSNLLVFGQPNANASQNSRQDQLQGTLALYQQIYSNLLNNYENIRLARLRSTPNVVQIEQAPLPVEPVQPQPLRNAGLGGASGLLIMGAIAFLIEYLDDTIKTPEDVSRALNLPVIGLIGEMSGKKKDKGGAYVSQEPRSPISEAFRSLRTNLEFAGVDRPLRTILVTSTGPGEGKSTVAINLATVLAQGDRKVVLVDADLRRPNLHKMLDVRSRLGLTDLLRSQDDQPATITAWDESNIAVITSGPLPPDPSELLGSQKMSRVLDDLLETADIVILDSPPSIVADPVVLSAKVDGVLLLIEPGKTKIEAAQAMLELLRRAEARVVGVVLNNIRRRHANYYYGKYRYYSNYYTRDTQYYQDDDPSNPPPQRLTPLAG